MTKPGEGSQVCPRCKLVSPSTATACDCGYDLRVSWDDQPSQVREKARSWPKTRVAGVLLICVAALIVTVSLTRGVPDFLGGVGWLKGLVEAILAWGAAALFFAVGLILVMVSYKTPRQR